MSATQALAKTGPQSTGIGLYDQAPNQTSLATVVPLDRENLTFFASMIRGANLIPSVQGVSPEVQFNRVMAKIVQGAGYGFDPMLSQTAFHVIHDTLSISAQGQEILFRRSGEYDTRIKYLNDDGCKLIVLKNVDDKWTAIGEVEFTREMAKTAELTKNAMYRKFGPDMFFARAMTRVVKRFNPSCLQPIVILGNHFARESQPSFGVPQTPAANQLSAQQEETPTQEPEVSNSQSEAVEIESEVIQEEVIDMGDGEVVEYAEPVEFTGEPQAETVEARTEVAGSEADESRHYDLLNAAKDLYSGLKGPDKKKADGLIGVGRLLPGLSTEELSNFLSTFDGTA